MRVTEPSDRNHEIFYDVEFGGVSLRRAAEKYALSPTRIQQIVIQVRDWFQATAPDWAVEGDPQRTAMLASRIAEERFRFLYTTTIESFFASQAEVTVRREFAARPGAIATTSRCFGEAVYLREAVRITQASLACSYRHALLMERLQSRPAPAENAPPAEVCAREAESTRDAPPPAPPSSEQSPTPAVVCDSPGQSIITYDVPIEAFTAPVRSRLEERLARHEKRKAARDRKRARRLE